MISNEDKEALLARLLASVESGKVVSRNCIRRDNEYETAKAMLEMVMEDVGAIIRQLAGEAEKPPRPQSVKGIDMPRKRKNAEDASR